MKKALKVKDNEEKINHLNELEFFGNVLLANVYLTNKIVAINIDNGKVIRLFIRTFFWKKFHKFFLEI